MVTILFFSGEKWLRDGWYYIPDRAIAIALGLCVFWQIVLTAGTCFFLAWIRKKFDGWMRMIIRVPVIVAAVFAPIIGVQAVWYAVPMGWAANYIISFMRYLTGKWSRVHLISGK